MSIDFSLKIVIFFRLPLKIKTMAREKSLTIAGVGTALRSIERPDFFLAKPRTPIYDFFFLQEDELINNSPSDAQ
jgi:hypothetical protein